MQRSMVPVRAALVLSAVGLAAGAGCASGGIGNPEGWSTLKSSHFTVYVGTPRHAEATLTGLEYTYSALHSSFFKTGQPENIDVLFLEDEDYPEVVGFKRPSVALATVPGPGPIGKNGLLVLKNDPSGDSGAEALTHIFIDKRFTKAPLFFHEGFAAYARTVEYQEGEGRRFACFGSTRGSEEPFMPLEKFLAVTWDDYDGDDARGWYKYTGKMLIDYIFHSQGGKNMSRMSPLVHAIADGKAAPEVIADAFPNVALSVITKQIQGHGADVSYQNKSDTKARGLCPLPFPIPDENKADDRDRKTEPAPAASIKALLEALEKLPRREGYPPWYPADVIARVK
jgi:hypothetical protein